MKIKTALSLSALAAALTLPIAAGAGAPKLTVDAPGHYWGTVFQGSRLEHTFTLRNEGNALLEISAVRTSCGCTVASGWPNRLEPGGKAQLLASLDSEKRNGATRTTVTIMSNDPAQPTTTLTLEAYLQRAVEIRPRPVVLMRNVAVGQPSGGSVEMYPVAGRKMTIGEVRCNTEFLEAQAVRRNAGGREGYLIAVKLKPGLPAGRVHDRITMTATVQGAGVLSLSLMVMAEIVGNVTVTPLYAAFRGPEAKDGVSRIVTLKPKPGKAIKVGKLVSDRENVRARVLRTKPGGEVEVELTVQRLRGVKERLTGTVRAYVDLPNEPYVNLLYDIVVPGAVPAPGRPH